MHRHSIASDTEAPGARESTSVSTPAAVLILEDRGKTNGSVLHSLWAVLICF